MEKLQHEVQATESMPTYVMNVEPQAILWKQKKQVRANALSFTLILL